MRIILNMRDDIVSRRWVSSQSINFFTSTVIIFLLLIIAIQYDELCQQASMTTAVSESSVNKTTSTSPPPTESDKPTSFPKKIWYKMGAQGVSNEAKRFQHHCLSINPGYKSEVLTDVVADEYIWKWYSHRPDILDTYFSLRIPILRADFLRYLILYAHGGVWFDLDVSCEDVGIKNWVLEEYKNATNLVVGLEFDIDWQDDGVLWSQFASWTVMAKPNSPHLMRVIDAILVEIEKIARRNHVAVDGIQLSMVDDVVDLTGPKMMTSSIVKSLGERLGRELDDRDIGNLASPKLIHDVLILPGNAFAGSQNEYQKDKVRVLVSHHYAGTWKTKFGGEGAKDSEQEKEIERETEIERQEEIEEQELIGRQKEILQDNKFEQKNEYEQEKPLQ